MIRSANLPPALSVVELEQWRQKLATRLALLAIEPDPLTVETSEYDTADRAKRERGKLTTLLLMRINAINVEIRRHTRAA